MFAIDNESLFRNVGGRSISGRWDYDKFTEIYLRLSSSTVNQTG